jgi:hypothetical protein
MLELLNNQMSGNDWGQPVQAMLHELIQNEVELPPRCQHYSVFKDLENEMALFEAEHQAIISAVRKYYVVPTDSSVTTFFDSHRTLPELLLLAIPFLKQYFGDDTVFSLRAPIDESGSQTLYSVAMWPGKMQDARVALERFDDNWWIANSRQASGYLTFTYELV